MPRVLLVSYTQAQRAPALRLLRTLTPSLHVELANPQLFPAKTVVGVDDLLTRDQRAKILDDAIAWLGTIPKVSVGNRNVAESLMHGPVSLWWWIESPFWFGDSTDSAFPPMSTLLESVEAFRVAVESKQYDGVRFVSDTRTMASLAVRDAAYHIGLPFAGPSPKVGSRFMDLVRPRVVPWLLRRRRSAVGRVATRSVRALLVSHLNALRLVGERRQDVYLGPLAREFTTRGVPHAICYVNSTADARPLTRAPIPDLPRNGFLLEQAISSAPANESRRFYRQVLGMWRGIEPTVLRAAHWRGIPLPRTLRARLGETVRHHVLSAGYYLMAFEELFGTFGPEAIIVTNETGYAGRAAIAAGRRLSIRSIGVQHGLITPRHIEYVKGRQLMDPRAAWTCPFPDMTALDGQYYQDVLTRVGGYPDSATCVTGQMRYETHGDLAPGSVERVGDRIVIATQPFDRETWTADVLAACRNLGNVIIKPHPLETAAVYEGIMSRLGVTATLAKDVDLPRLLLSASALVTQFSTTVVEAALASCPAIIYNPKRRPPPIPFADLGGAVEAESLPELRQLLVSALNGEDVRRKLAGGRSRFLEQFAFGGGSGAAGRIADLVERPETIRSS